MALWIDAQRVVVTWAPGLGLTLRILGSSYYRCRSRHTFPQASGQVSALDIRRAQEELILQARNALRMGQNHV